MSQLLNEEKVKLSPIYINNRINSLPPKPCKKEVKKMHGAARVFKYCLTLRKATQRNANQL